MQRSALCWQLLAALSATLAVAARAYTVHTVIPTECKAYFTWQSLGMFYSHRRAGQAGPMTRILCCTKEEYDKLSDVEKNLVPTHWAPSYTVHPRTGDVYHAYNKPLAVLDWMSKTEIKEDFVLVIDADMIMRESFVPEELGAKPGWAVAAFFGYMKGTDNQLALTHVPEVAPRNDTLAGRKGRRGDMAGGFTLMAREDMRRVAPLWLKYTERVREDPGAWNLTGDEWTKKPGDKPWISEMYGYSFGCAKADVWHITHSEHMLYPGYDTVDPPKVLHYGLHWQVKNTPYEFDKHWHFDFDPLVCPPWDLSDDPKKTKKGLFAHPPSPKSFKTKGFDLLRDLLSVEPIIVLNAAFCERHLKNCPPTEELTRECNRAHELEAELDAAYKVLKLPDPCVNRAKECEWWASVGECEKTAGWMYSHCRPACKWCTPKKAAKKKKAVEGTAEGDAAAEATTAEDQQQHEQAQEGGSAATAADSTVAGQGQVGQITKQEATGQSQAATATTSQDAAAGAAAQQGAATATMEDGAAAASKHEEAAVGKQQEAAAATATDAATTQDAAAAAQQAAAGADTTQAATAAAVKPEGTAAGTTSPPAIVARQDVAASSTAGGATATTTATQEAVAKRELIGQVAANATEQQGQAAAGGASAGTATAIEAEPKKDKAAGKAAAATVSGAQQRQQEAAAAAAQQASRGGGEAAGAGQAGAQGATVVDPHLEAITAGGVGGIQSRVEQDLSESGSAEAKQMPFTGEVLGVQSMLGHHIRMLVVFWGAVLVAVLFKMRRRFFKPRHHHLRPRLLSH